MAWVRNPGEWSPRPRARTTGGENPDGFHQVGTSGGGGVYVIDRLAPRQPR
jgi:hypothetical protein